MGGLSNVGGKTTTLNFNEYEIFSLVYDNSCLNIFNGLKVTRICCGLRNILFPSISKYNIKINLANKALRGNFFVQRVWTMINYYSISIMLRVLCQTKTGKATKQWTCIYVLWSEHQILFPEVTLMYIEKDYVMYSTRRVFMWSCGVMVSTWDSESQDPSSNLGRTLFFFFSSFSNLLHGDGH